MSGYESLVTIKELPNSLSGILYLLCSDRKFDSHLRSQFDWNRLPRQCGRQNSRWHGSGPLADLRFPQDSVRKETRVEGADYESRLPALKYLIGFFEVIFPIKLGLSPGLLNDEVTLILLFHKVR